MRADAKKNYDNIISVARQAFMEQGATASLREIARRAGVGMGTFYRHFSTREALLEVLLRESFDSLAQQAENLKNSSNPQDALLTWVQDVITFTYENRGIISIMVEAIEDLDSELHESCHALRSAGTELLSRAQSEGLANPELTGDELFDLIAALAWLREQPSHASRSEHLFSVIANSLIIKSS